MITNAQSRTNIQEIADGIYRINTLSEELSLGRHTVRWFDTRSQTFSARVKTSAGRWTTSRTRHRRVRFSSVSRWSTRRHWRACTAARGVETVQCS